MQVGDTTTAKTTIEFSNSMLSALTSCFRGGKTQTNPTKDEISEDIHSVDRAATVTNRQALVMRAKDHHIYLDDGKIILDACGGAAVACLGHGNKEVIKAITKQANKFSYISWATFESQAVRDLQEWFVRSSGGVFLKAYLLSSGSEAMEGSMKLAREYFVWKGEPQRVNFIAREESYHGITVGALSLGGHVSRRAPFEAILTNNVHHISACNAYRQRLDGESDAAFVLRKANELDAAFRKLGGDTVCAFVMEPVVGAASGCVPAVPGYTRAMKEVCDKYGALLIFDEVMCGMGRTGTLHAWEQDGVAPDIQAVGKGLAGGYQAASAILVGRRVFDVMDAAGVAFTHGHTYQNHPVAAAAALAVQRIIERDKLIQNVERQGALLGSLLRGRLATHPNVGDVRGKGLFWGIEFVRDRATKEPFDPMRGVARRVHELAMSERYGVLVYSGQGCAGGGRGDHIMVMPGYNVTSGMLADMVDRVCTAIEVFFAEETMD